MSGRRHSKAEPILDSTPEQRALGGAQLQLGGPLRAPVWLVPQVELHNLAYPPSTEPEPCLVWRFWNNGRVGKTRPADAARGALDAFLKLKDASDKAIMEFAQEWGVLGLCKHREPFTHNHRIDISMPLIAASQERCLPEGDAGAGVYLEPVAAWRGLINEASMIVRTVAQLLSAEPLSSVAPKERERVHLERLRKWTRVHRDTQHWITRSAAGWAVYEFPSPGVSDSAEWVMQNPRRLQLTADLPMLYDVLAFQLALAITRSEGLFVCAACNQPFVRASRPEPGRRVFCRSCGRRAAMRFLMRKRRAREKEKKR